MTVQTGRYVRRPLYVEAVQVTQDNFADVAAWCQGEIRRRDTDEVIAKGDKSTPHSCYIRVRVQTPKNTRQTRAYISDWILYTDRGYKVYNHKAFETGFDEIHSVQRGEA